LVDEWSISFWGLCCTAVCCSYCFLYRRDAYLQSSSGSYSCSVLVSYTEFPLPKIACPEWWFSVFINHFRRVLK
jgi:hypothetical protein